MEADSVIVTTLLLGVMLENSAILRKKGRSVLKLSWKDSGQEQNYVQISLNVHPHTGLSSNLLFLCYCQIKRNW